MDAARRADRPRPIALTGTPGTGKSRVARSLGARWRVSEVGDLARSAHTARGAGRAVEVDLRGLDRWLDRHPAERPDLLVGHLAHLLDVDGAIVLRCRPTELRRRLARARRGGPRDRQANAIAEAVDLVLRESLDRRLRVWEIDTTHRPPDQVARAVERILRDRPTPARPRVDWLADPEVTAHLLDRPS